LRENHEKVLGSPGFPARGTHRGQSCAAFFTESRMRFDGTTKLHRKSGFGLHQLRNRCSAVFTRAERMFRGNFVLAFFLVAKCTLVWRIKSRLEFGDKDFGDGLEWTPALRQRKIGTVAVGC
jgi:hypothetical protein